MIINKKRNFSFILFYFNNFYLKKKFFINKNLNKYFYKLLFSLIVNLNPFFIMFNYNLLVFNFFNNFFFKLNKNLLFVYCGFSYSKIFLKVGLGFRKKYSLNTKIYSLFVGKRKWVLFNIQPSSFFFNIRRRNIFMFCNSKQKLYENLIKIKYMRSETVYKVKGIMSLNRIIFNKKISRSIIFARRVKFRRMKLKLTKKQKQRK